MKRDQKIHPKFRFDPKKIELTMFRYNIKSNYSFIYSTTSRNALKADIVRQAESSQIWKVPGRTFSLELPTEFSLIVLDCGSHLKSI